MNDHKEWMREAAREWFAREWLVGRSGLELEDAGSGPDLVEMLANIIAKHLRQAVRVAIEKEETAPKLSRYRLKMKFLEE